MGEYSHTLQPVWYQVVTSQGAITIKFYRRINATIPLHAKCESVCPLQKYAHKSNTNTTPRLAILLPRTDPATTPPNTAGADTNVDK